MIDPGSSASIDMRSLQRNAAASAIADRRI
jgi:hypothetical protein